MSNIVISLILMILSSCGFVPSKDKDKEKSIQNTQLLSSKVDSDGDQVNDLLESELGRSPYIADLPRVKVNFLQNYQIKILYEDDSELLIDTQVERNDPDFKYRIGNLYLKEYSLNNAAKFGRFSGISSGVIKQRDYSWTKYPDIDESYYFKKKKEFLANKSEIKDITITLDNSIKLIENQHFNEINKLELKFYYHSYKKEDYIQIHTQIIDRSFLSGNREEFTITISNPPKELISDSYMNHGEFIVAEISDYFIPSLNAQYSTILESVKDKCISIYKTTPFENTLEYVSINSKGESFVDILNKLYPEKFEIQDNKLTRLEQFSNNLPRFKYLNELKGEDKLGSWFIMTNKLKRHYLKHKFTAKDSITLSYILGSELATRSAEDISSFRSNVSSGKISNKYILGNITQNSELFLSLYPFEIQGVKLISDKAKFSYKPPRCRNCSGNKWSVWADLTRNQFKDFKKSWSDEYTDQFLSSFNLYINNLRLDHKKLLEDNLLTVSISKEGNINIHLKSINNLDIIRAGSENIASIEFVPLSSGIAYEGMKIDDLGGRNINKLQHASMIMLDQASGSKVKIATDSWRFKEWENLIPWGKSDQSGWKPERGMKKTYYKSAVIVFASKITNFYN